MGTRLSVTAVEPGRTGNVADFAAGISQMVTADPDVQAFQSSSLPAFQYGLLLEARRRRH